MINYQSNFIRHIFFIILVVAVLHVVACMPVTARRQAALPTPTPVPTFTPTPITTIAPSPMATAVTQASLSGRILDQNNAPIAEARVRAGAATGITDTDGSYTLTGLTPGQYVLSVTHPDYDPGLSSILTVAADQPPAVDLSLYAPNTSPYPDDPMLTNPLDPNGAPTPQDAERLARLQGMTGQVVNIRQTHLSGEFLVNYKIGDDIRAAVAEIDHEVWELTDDSGQKWWVIQVCGNLASLLPGQEMPIPTPMPRPLLPMAEVVVDRLNVRACASTECEEVGTIQHGTRVEVFGCLAEGGDWCEVGWSGGRGWCMGQSLRQLAVAEAVLEVTPVLPTATSGVAGARLGTIQRVSIASDGTQGNGGSYEPSISADGRYVAFTSFTSNLVGDDTNNQGDIFVHDRQMGQTTRVSIASNGTQGNGFSGSPSISADGRYVVFQSNASNLVSGDTNNFCNNDLDSQDYEDNCKDIFVHDRQTGQTSLVSVASDGTQGNGFSGSPSISADGRYVVFQSDASTLVNGDTNDEVDIFVHDRQAGQTSRVSVASDGTQGNGRSIGPTISADGHYVVFQSNTSNLVSDDTNTVCVEGLGVSRTWKINCSDVFVHNLQTNQSSLVSVASDGTQGNEDSYAPSISANGRYVAFASEADNLVDGDTNNPESVYVHDRQTGQTTRTSVASDGTQGNGFSSEPSISADGRYVAFRSSASNLVGDDTNNQGDIFVHDRQTGQTIRVSVGSDGTQGNELSWRPSISADGRYVVFQSDASNLVKDDTNGTSDIFVQIVRW